MILNTANAFSIFDLSHSSHTLFGLKILYLLSCFLKRFFQRLNTVMWFCFFLNVSGFITIWTDFNHVITLFFGVIFHIGSEDSETAAESAREQELLAGGQVGNGFVVEITFITMFIHTLKLHISHFSLNISMNISKCYFFVSFTFLWA